MKAAGQLSDTKITKSMIYSMHFNVCLLLAASLWSNYTPEAFQKSFGDMYNLGAPSMLHRLVKLLWNWKKFVIECVAVCVNILITVMILFVTVG